MPDTKRTFSEPAGKTCPDCGLFMERVGSWGGIPIHADPTMPGDVQYLQASVRTDRCYACLMNHVADAEVRA